MLILFVQLELRIRRLEHVTDSYLKFSFNDTLNQSCKLFHHYSYFVVEDVVDILLMLELSSKVKI